MPASKTPRPDVAAAQAAFGVLVNIIADLRDPETGCPWDLEQTHDSLRRFMIEEAYEAAEVMSGTNSKKLAEELGDVLLQVVLNAQLGHDAGTFSLVEVIKGISEKMVRRHPHVFGNTDEKQKREKSQIVANWAETKKKERLENKDIPTGVFADKRIMGVYPASRQANEIGKLAREIDFDWTGADDVLAKLVSEVSELREAWKLSSGKPTTLVLEEIGDVFFSLAQFCRHLNQDPEVMAWDGNRKFLKRFEKVEELARQRGIDVRTCGQKSLEKLWLEAKLENF